MVKPHGNNVHPASLYNSLSKHRRLRLVQVGPRGRKLLYGRKQDGGHSRQQRQSTLTLSSREGKTKSRGPAIVVTLSAEIIIIILSNNMRALSYHLPINCSRRIRSTTFLCHISSLTSLIKYEGPLMACLVQVNHPNEKNYSINLQSKTFIVTYAAMR